MSEQIKNFDIATMQATQVLMLGGSSFTSKKDGTQYYVLKYYRPGFLRKDKDGHTSVGGQLFVNQEQYETVLQYGVGVYELLLLPDSNQIGLLKFVRKVVV